MPSTDSVEDPRLVELAAVNCRLKTVISFLKSKHTADSLDRAVDQAQSGIGDHTPAFVPIDSAMVRGTRHMGSLLQLAEVLEIKAQIGQADTVFQECSALLERKVALLKEIYSV